MLLAVAYVGRKHYLYLKYFRWRNKNSIKLNQIIMASRKNLKKVITFVVDELATEAFFLSYDAQGDTDAWVALFNRIFSLNNEYIARVNHVEPGMPAKKYFNTLCDSFNADAKALLDEIVKLAGK